MKYTRYILAFIAFVLLFVKKEHATNKKSEAETKKVEEKKGEEKTASVTGKK